jgi:hypothetical protein
LFTAVNSNITDVSFFEPGTTVAATTSAFAAIFVDVEVANLTKIEFFDQNDALMFSRDVLVAGNHVQPVRARREAQAEIQDEGIAGGRHHERPLQADGIGQHALHERHHGAADDGHAQDARSLAGELAQRCSAMLKMVGNMIELHRPTARIAHMAAWPWPKMATMISAIERPH